MDANPTNRNYTTELEEITCDPRLALIIIELAKRVEFLENKKPSYVPPPVFGGPRAPRAYDAGARR